MVQKDLLKFFTLQHIDIFILLEVFVNKLIKIYFRRHKKCYLKTLLFKIPCDIHFYVTKEGLKYVKFNPFLVTFSREHAF